MPRTRTDIAVHNIHSWTTVLMIIILRIVGMNYCDALHKDQFTEDTRSYDNPPTKFR